MKQLILLLSLMTSALGEAERKPDILFILADDFAYDCLAYAGIPLVKTPNLDRLAQRSTSFTNTYNMGSWTGAVCQASRAMLNSGRFLWQAKNIDFVEEAVKSRMWSQQFKKAGYKTWMAGKWHVNKKASNWKKFDPLNCFDSRAHAALACRL